MTALAVIILWCAFLVRDVLLLIYVSGLFAIGFSPIVRLIERQKVLPIARAVAALAGHSVLYVVILGTLTGIGFMIVPPLADQGRQLVKALPDMFDRAAGFPDREGAPEGASHVAGSRRARARQRRG